MTAIGPSSLGIKCGNTESRVMMEVAIVSKDRFQLQITNIQLTEISNKISKNKLREKQNEYLFNNSKYLLGDEISWDI
jgi:hypothetical protein